MSPSHAELQAQALSATNTIVDLKRFGFAVETPTGKTLYNTETAIKTVDHSLYQTVRNLLLGIPKTQLRSLLNPFPLNRL